MYFLPHLPSSYLIHLDINSELDELDREEFYRLKKVRERCSFPIYPLLTPPQVKNNKQRDQEIVDKEELAKRHSKKEGSGSDKENQAEDTGTSDLLGEQGDEDVIF
jgi:V-type H+-transporting ATPase subunit D